MSLDSYRSHVETVRDPDLIEKWKQENSTQVAYKLRELEGAPALTLGEVDKIFMQDHTPALVVEGNRFIVPAEAAARFEDSRLRDRGSRIVDTREPPAVFADAGPSPSLQSYGPALVPRQERHHIRYVYQPQAD